MGRSRGSRSGRSGRVAAGKAAAGSFNTSDYVEVPLDGRNSECAETRKSITATCTASDSVESFPAKAFTKLPPTALVQVVDGPDSISSTASPSHAGTAVSTPTSHGTIMANGDGGVRALDEEKAAEQMVNELISTSADDCPASLQLAVLAPMPAPAWRGPEPWALPNGGAVRATQRDGTLSSDGGCYRDHLRSRGRSAMYGSNLWRPIAMAEATVESEGILNGFLSTASALGPVGNIDTTSACASPPMQASFQLAAPPTASNGSFFSQPQVLPMPSPMQPQLPLMPLASSMPALSPMHTPVAPENSSVDHLLAIAMPGHLGRLSNSQIEEQLRAAASHIDVYDD